MKTWMTYAKKFLLVAVPLVYFVSMSYMVWFIITDQAPLIPKDPVQTISHWTYIDEKTGAESINTPVKVRTDDRNVFVFQTTLPDKIGCDSYVAFLNRTNLKVEVGGKVAKEWNKSDAPIIGGPAKNSYFITKIETEDAGQKLKVTINDDQFSGKFFNAFVGNEYELVRFLEKKSGAVQFAMSFSLLVCSLAIIVAGLVMRGMFRQKVNLLYIAFGVFFSASWMIVDSFVFQFLFRAQFIDGLMSYMCTQCIIFPFLGYLDSIQEHRYSKWYIGMAILEFISLIYFTTLHMTQTMRFHFSLPFIDGMVGLGIVMAFIITIIDIKKGNAKKYKYVAYGFLVFMIMSLIEIIFINTIVERVEGGMIIIGLYVLFAFAIVQQIMEVREVQLERDRANEEGVAKTQFLASMSHEIRTPINSILGMNEMILKESRDPNIQNYAGIINDSGTLLLSLINDVLDVSKIGSDMEEIVCANYDPAKMFDNAAEMLRTQATKKGLEIKVGKPRNLPPLLYGDEKRVTQVVVNLITNAVKYTEEGIVTFTGECFEEKEGYVLTFYVSDTGIGIKQEDLEAIFYPFQRLDLKKNQSIQGTGLGLSIVKSLVEKMGGSIKVDSTYGKGSTFSVKIPQKKMDENALDKYNSGNAIEDDDLTDIDDNYIAPDARILEVDDNTANQVVVKEFLKATGVQLDIASGGKEAIRLCKVNKYDVILMDHMMPTPDGIETMHLIKSDETRLNADTPQIILTANAIMGSRAKYEAEGFDNYLSKPVESVRLIKMVRKYLPDDKVMYKPKRRRHPNEEVNSTGDEAAAIAATVTSSKAMEGDAPVDIPALLARFDNKEETVKMILEEVVKEGERKIPLLRELLEKEDIKRYAIESHGVKGVMASSCITGLSATAKQHELAAKEGNVKFCKDNVESFLAEYSDVLEYIRKYLEGKTS